MALLNREQPLHLFAPAGLEEIIQLQLKVASTTLPFPLIFHPLEKEGLILEDSKFTVETFHTQHRIPCWGFLIREKKDPRKVDKEKAVQHHIPSAYYQSLKAGYDYTSKDGSVIYNDQVTIPNSPARSYAYCADTLYDERLATIAKDVTMIYHEATYLNGMEERATARFHSTTSQAATIALKANAGGLLLGHFSSKFEELHDYLKEALEVFPNTQLAIEGVTFKI